jgi:hypothetical protein
VVSSFLRPIVYLSGTKIPINRGEETISSGLTRDPFLFSR